MESVPPPERPSLEPDEMRLFKALFDQCPGYLVLANQAGQWVDANDSWHLLTGYHAGKAPDAGWIETVHPEDYERIRTKWDSLVQKQESFSEEFRLGSPDIRVPWVLGQASVIRSDTSGIVGYFCLMTEITDLRAREEDLRQNSEKLRRMMENSPDCIKVLTLEGHLVEMNDRGMCLLEIDDFNLYKDGLWLDFWIGPFHEQAKNAYKMALSGKAGHFTGPAPTVKGTPKWWDVVISPVPDPAGNTEFLLAVSRDITRLKEAENALYREKEQAQITLSSIADGVISTDISGNINYFNPVAERLTGWSVEESFGRPLENAFKVIDETTRDPINGLHCPQADLGKQHLLFENALLISRNGKEHPISASISPILNPDGESYGSVLVFRDISDARRMANQLSYQATHDALTGLLNRIAFEDAANRVINQARANNSTSALLYLDLDQFKVVNDTSGHLAGDELLKLLTQVFQKRIRQSDTLARLGGDEFGIILDGCGLDKAVKIAEAIIEDIGDFRFHWDSLVFRVGVSIGLVMIDNATIDLQQKLVAADTACYRAKDKGRNQVQVYRSTDDQSTTVQQEKPGWLSRINNALEEGRFTLYMQKISPLRKKVDETSVHMEILTRIIGENGEVIETPAFIPAAERYNLMTEIDRWVVTSLFSEISARHPRFDDFQEVLIGVNLSGVSVNSSRFLDFILEAFRQTDVPPAWICFEISESFSIHNHSQTQIFMTRLKALGCQFALDDFGSNISSLSYPRMLPIDYLKMDRTFIGNLESDPVHRAMVDAINRVCHAIGIKTVAENVDETVNIDLLREMNVDFAQGYGIHKPFPLNWNGNKFFQNP